jgi:lysophospholipase L1-like esterase
MLEPDLLGRLVEGLLLRPELAGRPALLVLVAPSGLGSCPPNPPVDSACGRFETQGALIARALQGQPAPFLDLRTLWEGGPSRVALSEREAEKQGGLGVHPDDEGHRMLAEAIARRLVGGMGG